MTDIKSPESRSKNMAAIKGKDTKPEVFVRRCLFKRGYRYRKNVTHIPGHPDVFLAKYNTAIFIHGCFWHQHPGCKYAYMPKSRVEFWTNKFERNMLRDRVVRQELAEKGIKNITIWECSIKKMQKDREAEECIMRELESFLTSPQLYLEI